MKKILMLSFFLLSLLSSFAQKQKGFFEIADKKIFYETEKMIPVSRTVSDTIFSCTEEPPQSYKYDKYMTYVTLSELRIQYHEKIDEGGCVWTRVTNDVIREDEKEVFFHYHFLNDSEYLFSRPSFCFLLDTFMFINPVTLEEKAESVVDSVTITKYDLGSVSRTDFSQAISSQFNLYKNEIPVKLKTLSFEIFNDKCDRVSIDYSKPGEIERAMQKIKNVPAGSLIIIRSLDFDNTDGRKIFHTFYAIGDVTDLAIMKIKE